MGTLRTWPPPLAGSPKTRSELCALRPVRQLVWKAPGGVGAPLRRGGVQRAGRSPGEGGRATAGRRGARRGPARHVPSCDLPVKAFFFLQEFFP